MFSFSLAVKARAEALPERIVKPALARTAFPRNSRRLIVLAIVFSHMLNTHGPGCGPHCPSQTTAMQQSLRGLAEWLLIPIDRDLSGYIVLSRDSGLRNASSCGPQTHGTVPALLDHFT
jgi:hypothetical protein